MRNLALMLVLLLPIRAAAQVPEYPYPNFVPGAIIASGEVNANFSHVSDFALNRTGGTIEGHITIDPNITLDGVDVSDYFDGLGRVRALTLGTVTDPSFAPSGQTNTGFYLPATGQAALALSGIQRLLLNASGLTVLGTNIFNSGGKISAITSTYFANLNAQDLQPGEGSFTDGTSLARLAAGETISGAYTFQNTLTISPSWGNAGTTFTGLLVSVTNTASAAGSAPLKISIGGAEKLKVDPTGKMVASGLQITAGAANAAFLVGDANGVGTWLPSATTSPVPAGMLAFFEASCPSGWTLRSGVGETFENKFVRGGATYSATGGGSDTHSHSIDPPNTASGTQSVNHTHNADPAITGTSSVLGHAHSGSFTTSTDGSHTHNFTTGVPSATNEAALGGVANDADPNHTHSSTTDAAGSHSHAFSYIYMFLGDGCAGCHSHTIDYPSTASGIESANHTHSADIGTFSSAAGSNVPAYVQVVICRKD